MPHRRPQAETVVAAPAPLTAPGPTPAQADQLLVRLVDRAEPQLQTMALGCVVRLVLMPTTMHHMISDLNVMDLFMRARHPHTGGQWRGSCMWP